MPDWLATVELLGAVQGLFLSAVLAGSRSNRTANRVLAVAMAAFSLDLFVAWAYATGLDTSWPHVIGADYLLPFLYGPIVYVYARSLMLGGRALPGRWWLHFVPLLLILAVFVPFYAQTAGEKLELRIGGASNPWTPWLVAVSYLKLAYTLTYLVVTLGLLRRHREAVRQRFSTDAHVGLLWLRNVLVGGMGLWLLSLLVYVFGQVTGTGDSLAGVGEVVPVALAVYVYAIGYLGLRQREMPAPGTARADRPPAPRYERSGLDRARAESLARDMVLLMTDERLYRQPGLSLADLAARLDSSPQHCSEALNSRKGRSFYEFVNGYRVDEVRRRIEDPSGDAFTLLALAEEAGFASKSAFNSAFKRETGMTPSAFRRSVRSNR